MRFRAIAIVAALLATVATAAGQGAGGGSGSGSDSGGDIEMDPEPVGSGSGSGSGSSTATPPPTGSGSDATPAKDPKTAKKWRDAAAQLVQKGDYFTSHGKPSDAKDQYLNAITAYQKAIEAGDDVVVNYSLALVEDKVGALADAHKHLRVVIAAGTAVKPDVVKKAQAKLDEISGKVGVVTMVVKPDGTTVTISGKEYGEAPLTEPIVLVPGTYTASFSAAGYQPKDAELKVEAGSESERKIELEPIPIAVKPHVIETSPETPVEVKKANPLPLYIGAGATGAFLLAEVITGISAISQHHAFTDPTFSNSERKDAQSLGHTMQHLSDVFLIAAIGSAAFTAYWYQYKYKPALAAEGAAATPEQRNVPKVDVIPWVEPSGGGVSAIGSF